MLRRVREDVPVNVADIMYRCTLQTRDILISVSLVVIHIMHIVINTCSTYKEERRLAWEFYIA